MYIYLGKYYHKSGKELPELTEKKIGLTKSLENRERELNSTKFTVGYTFVRAWETGADTFKVEKSLHAILDDQRMDGEWFEDITNTLVSRLSKFMNIQGYPEINLLRSDINNLDDNDRAAIDATDRQVQQATYLEVKNRLSDLGIEFSEHFNNNKMQPIVAFNINDVKIKIGIYKSGTKFWMHTVKDSGSKYFSNDERFTQTSDGWRLGNKGELYATDIDDLFEKLDIFIQTIKK